MPLLYTKLPYSPHTLQGTSCAKYERNAGAVKVARAQNIAMLLCVCVCITVIMILFFSFCQYLCHNIVVGFINSQWGIVCTIIRNLVPPKRGARMAPAQPSLAWGEGKPTHTWPAHVFSPKSASESASASASASNSKSNQARRRRTIHFNCILCIFSAIFFSLCACATLLLLPPLPPPLLLPLLLLVFSQRGVRTRLSEF